MFWGRVQDYWLPTPLACSPFTSPTVRHRVPSGFNWALPVRLQRQLPDKADAYRQKTSIGKQPITRKCWVPNRMRNKFYAQYRHEAKQPLSQKHTVAIHVKNLANNQFDAQFFKRVYLYSLHVSGSHVPIIRRIIVSMRHLVFVTLCRWPSGMPRSSTQGEKKTRCHTDTIILLMMGTWLHETCRK